MKIYFETQSEIAVAGFYSFNDGIEKGHQKTGKRCKTATLKEIRRLIGIKKCPHISEDTLIIFLVWCIFQSKQSVFNIFNF